MLVLFSETRAEIKRILGLCILLNANDLKHFSAYKTNKQTNPVAFSQKLTTKKPTP